MSDPTVLDLLEMQVEALFTHDGAGSIVRINAPGGRVAPRMFFGRTAQGNLWRLRVDVPADVRTELTRLAAAEPVNPDLQAPPDRLAEMQAVLGDAPISHHGPAWVFPSTMVGGARAVRLTREHQRLLADLPGWRDDFDRDEIADEPRFGMVVEGRVVAICGTVRLTDRVAEAGVETVAADRGRGYAVEVVTAWAREIRRMGRLPLYSTSWDNHASQAVARKLDLRLYGSDLSLS